MKGIFQNAFGFAAIFVALWLGVDVGLIYHGGGVIVDFPVFYWGWDFARETLARPGGAAGYVASLLMQTLFFSWFGALALTLQSAIIYVSARRCVKALDLPGPGLLGFIAPLLFFGIYLRYGHDAQAVMGLTLALAALGLFTLLPADRPGVRRAGLVFGLALLYPVAAGAEAVFAIMVALLEWRRSGGWRMSIGALALGVVLPLVEGWLVFGLAPEEVFASLLPMTQIHLMGHPPGLVPFGALYCLLPALGLGALARDAWRRWRSRKTCADPQEKPVSQLKIRPVESKKLRRKLKQAGKTRSQGAHHFDWVWRGGWIAQMFRAIQAGLAEAGMEMKHVARTWFYLDDILAWYGDFNRVRNDFFHQHNISTATMPASTGVSGRNVAGAALTAAVWAVRPEDPEAELVRTVASPGQCPAPAYGSAFSRAVEITASGFRQLLISGTASIAPGGKTSHVGNVEAQINRTMEAVEGILAARHMSLADTSRATAYFKSAKEVAVFAKWLKQRGVKHLPLVNVCCDICRPDLLFELELDALHAGIP